MITPEPKRKGTLRFRFTALRSPSYNKGYTVRGSARPSPKFCSVSLRKTSYIPNVVRHTHLSFHFSLELKG